jgi:hypothetical protein
MWMILFFFFFVSAEALTEKEQWLKDNRANLKISSIDPPAILDHGGPDEGGYYYIDSDDDAQNAPVFQWIDISDSGIPIILGDDENVGPFNLGFDVEFYGNTFSTIRVCSNGFLSFTSTSTAYDNRPIPSISPPNNLLAAFWEDLAPQNGGQVYVKQDTDPYGNLRFIVSYDGVPYYFDQGSLFFQVIIYEDGNIFYQYLSMDDGDHGNDDSTVGIENSDGSIGTEYLYNIDAIHDEMAIYFGLTPPIFADHDVQPTRILDPILGIGAVGDSINPEVRFLNSGGNTETFGTRLIIELDDELYNEWSEVTDLPIGFTRDVSFPSFTPGEEGAYEFIAISELQNDEIPSNDTLRMLYSAFANIYVEDFEGDDGQFVGDNDWEWGHPASGPHDAHSGENLWCTVLAGDYTVGPLLSALISPPLGLSDGAALTFWQWHNTESGFDGGNVKISADGGDSWEIISPEDGYDGVLSTEYDNPIGGEEAFYGESDGWIQETFDLSGYGGSSAIIKFDFGSDSSIDGPGWYVDEVIVYGGGGEEPGWVSGTVTDLGSGEPIEGAAVNAGPESDLTDENGGYSLELFAGVYAVTATAQYHNAVTVEGVEVVEGDTTILDFALPAPSIEVDTTPIETSVAQGETAEFTRNMANTGNGDLVFDVAISLGERRLNAKSKTIIRPGKRSVLRAQDLLSSAHGEYSPISSPGDPPGILDFGDEVFVFDPQTPSNDIACLGIEFDGTCFWVTGRYPDPGDDIHKLHKFDRDGNYIESFDQGTYSTWGWRDLAFDGTYLYGSDENELAVIDPVSGQKVDEIPMPSGINPPMRALAHDPETDHFWAANFNSNIIEFNRSGQTLASYANDYAAYGMAWDDISEGGPWLWVFSQDGTPELQISQFDPQAGSYTGIVFYAMDHGGENDDIAGGACFTTDWDPTLGVLFCMVQGLVDGLSADLVQGYEITPFSQWISVDPMAGSLSPSASIDLTLTLDFTGDDVVPDSVYQAQVIINNNSPDTPIIPVTVDVVTAIDDDVIDLPHEFSLYQNYPNPFNAATSIKFDLPEQSEVAIEVFNILGQKLAIVVEGLMPAGYHRVSWDASGVSSGIYFYRITAGEFVEVRTMTLLK